MCRRLVAFKRNFRQNEPKSDSPEGFCINCPLSAEFFLQRAPPCVAKSSLILINFCKIIPCSEFRVGHLHTHQIIHATVIENDLILQFTVPYILYVELTTWFFSICPLSGKTVLSSIPNVDLVQTRVNCCSEPSTHLPRCNSSPIFILQKSVALNRIHLTN